MKTLGAFLAVFLLWTLEAQAQPASAEPAMSQAELQGLSCLGFGTLSATTTTVLVILSPLEALTIPVIAAGFAAGCGVAAVAAPGVAWLGRRIRAWLAEPSVTVQATRGSP